MNVAIILIGFHLFDSNNVYVLKEKDAFEIMWILAC